MCLCDQAVIHFVHHFSVAVPDFSPPIQELLLQLYCTAIEHHTSAAEFFETVTDILRLFGIRRGNTYKNICMAETIK